MPKTRLLTVIGNIASGKSTAMPILTKAIDAEPLHADDLFQSVDPFARVYLEDTPRWAFTNELWLTHERSKMIRNFMTRDLEKPVIVDSGLLMSWVYTYSHLLVGNITQDEWDFYEKLYDHFSEGLFHESCVVRLKYPIATLMKRLKKRGRDYEMEFYTKEYVEQIEKGLVALEEKLRAKLVNVIEITEDEVEDFEANSADADKMVEKIQQCLK